MNLTDIQSHQELQEKIKDREKAYLLLYKSGSETSECSLKNLSEAQADVDDLCICVADVTKVRDIHTQYDIKSAPSLLEFENGKFKNLVKGCSDPSFYKTYFEDAAFFSASSEDGKPAKSVTVYTTPSCTWCNTLKSHLRKHRVYFNEVDVSQDMNAAEEMTRNTGQRGVPQSNIEGEWIVGFDKAKINRLLEIQEG